MQFRTTAASIAIVLAVAGAAEARAELKTDYGTFSATFSGVSQYRFRGLDRNDDRPTLQGSVDWAHDSGVYAGVWGSGVDLATAHAEADIYAGWQTRLNDLRIDFSGIGYLYPGADDNLDYNYFEGKGGLGYDFGVADLSGALYYAPDFFGDSGGGLYMNVNAVAPVLDTGVSITGSWGHQWVKQNARFGLPDYTDWSLGVNYGWKGFDFSGKYVDTDLEDTACPDGCDAAGVFSVSRTF